MRAFRRIISGFVVSIGAALLLPLGVAQSPQIPAGDWPQFGRDTGRSGYSPLQVDPPYCFTWKWFEPPFATRTQPVVVGGRLFVGGMDGYLYARDASSGAPLWAFATGGPIRNTAAVVGSVVVTGSHDGYTYGLRTADGGLAWRALTGSSVTAPLADEGRGRVYVASSNGTLIALVAATGAVAWQFDAGAPILTSPALSADGALVLFGDEAIEAVAVEATTGALRWRQTLQGQSLAERSPVVVGSSVILRSQPLYFFHELLHEGDAIMDQAGPVAADWNTDWAAVRPQIVTYLTQQPPKQTFFVLDVATGASRGVAPVLYTHGDSDMPMMPTVRGSEVYVAYRARHGIQTDGNTVHVTSKYDAELGRLDLGTLDITGIKQRNWPAFSLQFRMTSDESSAVTMGGNILFVDHFERLGGINVSTGDLIHVAGVSNDWPECSEGQCTPGGVFPVFPLTGSGAAYPFPQPRVMEGDKRPGVVIANNMIYWRVLEGGLVGIAHKSGSTCPAPSIWLNASHPPSAPTGVRVAVPAAAQSRPLADYVSLDLTAPVQSPPAELVDRLRREVRELTSAGGHLMPFYLDRGFTKSVVWPAVSTSPPGPPVISYNANGNTYWHDPGELLYTMALAYPYLDSSLQAAAKTYMADEMRRYPPLQNLPWSGMPWLKQGVARERYAVPFRAQINNWPPPAASLSALYGLWLWSKNTGDWSYASSVWADAKSLFAARKGAVNYYADISGAIGYARLATHFGDSAAAADGRAVAVAGLGSGLAFATFRARAESEYLDPRDVATGWQLPAFFGLTPEVGLYLREQLGGTVIPYVRSKEDGNGLRWWYLTRAGVHAEVGESSFIAPSAAWSHFLVHAYILGDTQAALGRWLDRSWARGDLYSIQKLVAAIQATK